MGATEQLITSRNTSIKRVSKAYTRMFGKEKPFFPYYSEIDKKPYILDYGCGKYDMNEKYAAEHDFQWRGYDPYNRSQKQNSDTLDYALEHAPNIIMCNNVLNVLSKKIFITNVLNSICLLCGEKTLVIFTIHEGNKSGKGCVSKQDCYQRNERTLEYLPMIEKLFTIQKKSGNLIACTRK